jgi:hypothetical protein
MYYSAMILFLGLEPLSFFETLFESAPINRQTNQYLTAHLKE